MKNFIVFDLEWNQNPGGKEASVERLPFEIFEIGAVKLNEEREKVAEFHRIISEVTHVSIEELERDGEPFAAVMEDFLKWCGEDCIFCTWGSMDLTELQRNMVYHGMTIPFPKPFLFYDVQKLYSLCYQDGKARISLDEAVESFALDVDAPFHRALGDAEYTGRVLQAMDFDSVKDYVSVDYYLPPESEDEEFTLRFPEYTKFVSQMFETKEEAMEEKRVTDIICTKCRRMLRKKIRWFSSGQRYYLCLATCPEHGMMKGKIRMKKSEDGRVFAVKTVKPVDEEGAEAVFLKKEEARIRRAEKSRQKKLHGVE